MNIEQVLFSKEEFVQYNSSQYQYINVQSVIQTSTETLLRGATAFGNIVHHHLENLISPLMSSNSLQAIHSFFSKLQLHSTQIIYAINLTTFDDSEL
jgi:hypothetical protein